MRNYLCAYIDEGSGINSFVGVGLTHKSVLANAKKNLGARTLHDYLDSDLLYVTDCSKAAYDYLRDNDGYLGMYDHFALQIADANGFIVTENELNKMNGRKVRTKKQNKKPSNISNKLSIGFKRMI